MKIYLIYRIYDYDEMVNEFGRCWEGNESQTRLYAWTLEKKLRNIFRDTHKKKKFIYETRDVEDVYELEGNAEEFARKYMEFELHISKFRYDYRLSKDQYIKVVTNDYEENILEDEWSDCETLLFQERSAIPTLEIFKDKYREVLDLINFSYYWASNTYILDDDVDYMYNNKSYGIGPCGFNSPNLVSNQFLLYVFRFGSILKKKGVDE